MKKSKIVYCLMAVLVLTLIVISYFAPVVEAASENETETVIYTNAHMDDTENDAFKDRAKIIDEVKDEAKDSVDKALKVVAENKKKKEVVEAVKEEVNEPETENDEVSNDPDEEESSYVAPSHSGEFLIETDNVDPNYNPRAISLSDSDRDAAERIIMGEAGGQGYDGMALVAQCIRDAYSSGNYSSIEDVIDSCGYYGSMSEPGDSTCKEVVRFIFDGGGSAVQHRILVFYNADMCTSSWHESQNFVCSLGSERFFDTY